MKDLWEGFEVFSGVLLPLFLSLVACLVQQAKHGWRGVSKFLRELIICSFVGVLIFWGLDWVDLPSTVDAALTSGGAFASLTLLDVLVKKISSVIQGYRVPGVVERPYDGHDGPVHGHEWYDGHGSGYADIIGDDYPEAQQRSPHGSSHERKD